MIAIFRSFSDVLDRSKFAGKVTISVAAAQDKEVLEAVKLASDIGLAEAILVGDSKLIRALLPQVGLPDSIEIIHEPDSKQAALNAVSLVRRGRAQVLMKGMLNSSDFLRAVLDTEQGLRTGRLLSHLAAVEIPGADKIVFITDGGMNIAPLLEEKKDILVNAMLALQCAGYNCPKVALLTANEIVNPKMPATLHAQELVEMSGRGELPPGVIEGPIAMDVAFDPEAAKHKNIMSSISGQVDLLLVPNIETGNAITKALIYFAKAKMVGLVLGATNPIVMTSRAETPEGKLNSIALACVATGRLGEGGEMNAKS